MPARFQGRLRTLVQALLLPLLFTACGSSSTDEDVAPEDMQLASAGFLGALPPREGRITIEIDADGTLRVDGSVCARAELAKRLDARVAPAEKQTKSGRLILRSRMAGETLVENLEETDEDTEEVSEQEIVAEEPVIRDAEIEDEKRVEPPTGPTVEERLTAQRNPLPSDPEPWEPDGSSNLDVLLRVDRRVPWAVVVDVLQTGARPERKLWRIFYAVDGEDGDGEGAMAVFLPKDRGCGEDVFFDVEVARVRLRSKEGPGRADVADLAHALRTRQPTPKSALAVTLVAKPLTPFEDVVTAMDAALRAGAVALRLEGLPGEMEDYAAYCAQVPKTGSFHWQVSGEPLMARPAVPVPDPRRASGYAGVVNDLAFLEEELVEEVDESEGAADADDDAPFSADK